MPLSLVALCCVSAPARAGNPFWVLSPQGPVAAAESKLLIIDAVIMLAIVVPTIIMAAIFIRRYRASNTKARYEPNWARSKIIEIPMWGIPLLAVGVLAYFVVTGSLASDPYHPAAIKSPSSHALEVDVISLDWKWLFVYPRQHIATVNALAIPVHTPVHFRLTSTTVTNSFFIPQLAGQIYVMPAAQTKLVLQADKIGTYEGFSAAQSGAGFSWMRFKTKTLSDKAFKAWVRKVRQSTLNLTNDQFERLAKEDIDQREAPKFFSTVAPNLFEHVISQAKAGKVYPTPLFAGKHMK